MKLVINDWRGRHTTAYKLLKIKNKGKLINTSVDVQKTCLANEYLIWMHNDACRHATYQKKI